MYLLRGLRTAADFEFERAIAQVNKAMAPEVESVFLLTVPEHTSINSTIVRDIIRSGGDASSLFRLQSISRIIRERRAVILKLSVSL